MGRESQEILWGSAGGLLLHSADVNTPALAWEGRVLSIQAGSRGKHRKRLSVLHTRLLVPYHRQFRNRPN